MCTFRKTHFYWLRDTKLRVIYFESHGSFFLCLHFYVCFMLYSSSSLYLNLDLCRFLYVGPISRDHELTSPYRLLENVRERCSASITLYSFEHILLQLLELRYICLHINFFVPAICVALTSGCARRTLCVFFFFRVFSVDVSRSCHWSGRAKAKYKCGTDPKYA